MRIEYWKRTGVGGSSRKIFFITQQNCSFFQMTMNECLCEWGLCSLFLVIRKRLGSKTVCYLAEKIVHPALLKLLLLMQYNMLLHTNTCRYDTDATTCIRHCTNGTLRRETTTLHTSNICYTPVLLRYFHYILLSNWGRHEARFFLSWIHNDRIVIHTSKYISCPKLRVVCDALSDLLSYHQVLFSGWSCQKTCPWGMYPAYLVLSDIKSVKTASQTLSFSRSLFLYNEMHYALLLTLSLWCFIVTIYSIYWHYVFSTKTKRWE